MTPPPAYLLQVLQCSFTHIQFSPNIQLLTVQIMASYKKNTTNSNKKILKDVTKLLGFCDPLYGTLNGNSDVACIVILTSNGGMPYFRVGHVSMNLIASEESAAAHCLQTLVNDFDLCIEHMTTDKCAQCEQCEKSFLVSSTKSTCEGKGSVALLSEPLSYASGEECLTPTDLASRIPCYSLPPPPKKRRVNWFPIIAPRSPQLIHLPPNFPDLFPKKKGGN